MDQGTGILIVLGIILIGVAAFSFQGFTNSEPLSSPPNPNAQFGVIEPQRSFATFLRPSGGLRPSRSQPLTNSNPSSNAPIADFIRLSRGNTRSNDPETEYITISFSSHAKEKINMTGWTLSNARGGIFSIGKISELPGLFNPVNRDPLIVVPGGRVHIITGLGTREGSFRANKCTGYFNESQSFTPSLPRSCPSPRNESGQEDLPDECIPVIRSLSSCRLPDLPFFIDNRCREYAIDHFSYKGCVDNHRNDEDFYRDEWWVYLKRPEGIWSNIRDTITLKDSSGNVVSELSYD